MNSSADLPAECKVFKVSHLKMNVPRAGHTMTRLDDGNIFIMGGMNSRHWDGLWTAEIFNPKLKTFQDTHPLYMSRFHHVAVKLLDGKVLLLGGVGSAELDGPNAPVEIFDPKTLRSEKIPNVYYQGTDFTANLLPDGRVLIVEGSSGKDYNTATDIMMFDPKKRTIEAWGNLNIPRINHSTLVLKNGNVLVAGGKQITAGQDQARITMELIDIKQHKIQVIQAPEYTDIHPEALARKSADNHFRLKYISLKGPMIELPGGFVYFATMRLLFDPKTHSFELFDPLQIQNRVNGTMLQLDENQLVFMGGMLVQGKEEQIKSVPTEIYNTKDDNSSLCVFYSDYLSNSSSAVFSPRGFIVGGGYGIDGNAIDTVKMIERE